MGSQFLNLEKILEVVGEKGSLSKFIKNFESRPEQKQMLRRVIEAYNQNRIALIEAGTGIGKSFAYLIPAIAWSNITGERTVISTHTIALQEQLIKKDIPVITQALGIEIKAVLIKGMSNYVCLRKLEEAEIEQRFLPPLEAEEISKIQAWSRTTTDGSRASMGFIPTHGTWERVGADQITCNRRECAHYKDCLFFRSRQQAQDAKILVVNHHLLCADIAQRQIENDYESTVVLPNYKRIILDEAHHIEDVATDFFGAEVGYLDMIHILNKLASDKGVKKPMGKLPILKEKLDLQEPTGLHDPLIQVIHRLIYDLPTLRSEISTLITNFFRSIHSMLPSLNTMDEGNATENKLRLREHHLQHPIWHEQILPDANKLKDGIAKMLQFVLGIENDLKNLKNTKLDEQTNGLRFDMLALSGLLDQASNHIQKCTERKLPPENVRWIEAQKVKGGLNTLITEAELDLAPKLAAYLFNPMNSVVMCSATLATGQNFNFVRQRLGLIPPHLEGKEVIEERLDSPFDFKKQALLAVPVDLPDPSHSKFVGVAAEIIWNAIQASQGHAFVLFTSYKMLKDVESLLSERLKTHRYPLLKQGEDTVQSLLTRFKQTDRAILFGTDSFWEGVDVVGDALRCVILMKLPFRVPSEPILQARAEAITAAGGDPFMEFSLPQAVVKFKQGFGRLVRSKKDRGCIVCLDNRLINKGYGKIFLNSLPDCEQAFVKTHELQQVMQDFYKRTHYLTQ